MRTSRALALTVVALSAAGMATCDTLGLGDGQMDELRRNQELWARVGPSAYEFGIERRCFCPEPARGPVMVHVVSGSVTELRYTRDGSPVPTELAESFPTVSGLFEILEEAFERDAFHVDAVYDPETGVPIDFWIDYSENIADEELGFRVTAAVRQLQ